MNSQSNSEDKRPGRPSQTEDSSEWMEKRRDPAYDEPEGKTPMPPPPPEEQAPPPVEKDNDQE